MICELTQLPSLDAMRINNQARAGYFSRNAREI
jgi:hypothetical protein